VIAAAIALLECPARSSGIFMALERFGNEIVAPLTDFVSGPKSQDGKVLAAVLLMENGCHVSLGA
jgi:hypothetical protein